ncbi:MAG: outer membrane beta-barrel protein [Phaeodactylibacter sp.]|nr:outer membrane beta-barrel protein [Phaeodactylibacter sp.]
MQDKYPQEFDEQFINQAWLNMKQLLDQEMPVHPNQRPAWWPWLLAGLLLLSTLVGGAYYFYQKGLRAKTDDTAPLPIASYENPSEKAASQQAPGTIASSQDLTGEQESVIKPEAAPSADAHSGKEAEKTTGRKITSSNDRYPAIPNLPLSPGPVSSANPAAAMQSESHGKQTEVIATANAVPPAGNRRWEAPLALLPLSQPDPLPMPTATYTATAGRQLSPPSNPLMLSLATEGGAIFLGRSFVDGLGGGLALEARRRNNRLYWRAGAFFRSYNPEAATAGQAFRQENSSSKEVQPDGSLANSRSLLYSTTTITNTSYLQFPLSAGFQWKPGLAFEAGLQAGFLLSGKANNTWSLDNSQSSAAGGGQPARPEIFEFRRENARNRLAPAAVDIFAGLVYRPGARSSLRVFYHFGLSDILAAEQDQAFLRGINMSMAYYIVK